VLTQRLSAPGDLLGMRALTDEQSAAVARRHGHTLLDAGAGSGKTTVLVERFVRAVRDDGVDPRTILAITFTNRAAGELHARVRAALHDAGLDQAARATDDGWISTIDAFCARVLRSHALEAGLDPQFSVLESDQASELADQAIAQALAEVAATAAGSELIAAHRLGDVAGAVRATYSVLRSRGERYPTLPTVPAPSSTLAESLRAMREAAAAFASELGAINDPGVTVKKALLKLERALEVRVDLLPWPSDLAALAPGGGGNAMRTEASEAYRGALTGLGDRIAAEVAAAQRDVFDTLLSAYGRHYEEAKRARGAVDFADLELLARELLITAEIGDRYRERFTHVMIDELQDSSLLQHQLIDAVTGPDTALFMVGDAQQSIYSFRHADRELFEARGAELEADGGRLSLQTNFRSQPAILEVINAGFADVLHPFRPLRPGLEAASSSEPLVELLVVDKGANWDEAQTGLGSPWRVIEARALASRLAALIGAGEFTPGEVVVLTRASTDLRIYEQALEAAGVPTFVVGGRGYWQHPQVIELRAYLRALANPLDQESLWIAWSSPLCGLSLSGLVLVAADARDELDAEDEDRLSRFEDFFEAERAQASRLGPVALLERATEQTDYDEWILSTYADGRRRLANVRKLLRLAREFEASAGPDLHGFVAQLARRASQVGADREAEAPVESEGLDAVRLMTIHGAKGLEFPVVCVADLGRGPFFDYPPIRTDGERLGLRIARPGRRKKVEALAYTELRVAAVEADAEEQRRLFYVAMTRAQCRLILSGATKLTKLGELISTPMDWIAPAFKDLPRVKTTLIEHSVAICVPIGPKLAQGGPTPAPPPPGAVALAPAPAVESVSYSGLSEYLKCALRFYAEHVIGLPPTQVPAATGGRERGIRLHAALARADFALPPQDPELEPLVSSPVWARLAQARDIRREQPFVFPLGELLITGTFDVLATEADGQTLVVDYKTDALGEDSPEQLVRQRYETQRLIYALAALRLGAATAEVSHLFLADPEHPATSTYTAADRASLEAILQALTAPLLAGERAPATDPNRFLCAGCPAAGGLCPWPLARTTG
jgi:ATP-dependent exoDNAse (exonuclease V) beta subunit